MNRAELLISRGITGAKVDKYITDIITDYIDNNESIRYIANKYNVSMDIIVVALYKRKIHIKSNKEIGEINKCMIK